MDTNNLLILGNGFDIAHGIPSSYNQFRSYMQCERKSLICQNKEKSAEEIKHVIDFFDSVLKNNKGEVDWGDLEQALGNNKVYEQMDRNQNISRIGHRGFQLKGKRDGSTDDKIGKLSLYTGTSIFNVVSRVLRDWITDLKRSDITKIDGFLSEEKFFDFNNFKKVINFNYTDTAQKYVSNDTKIIQIHVGNKVTYTFGHNERAKIDTKWGPDKDLFNVFQKDTMEIYNNKLKEELPENIEGITTYGFSFSDPDMPYVEYLIKDKKIDQNTKWTIFIYREEEKKKIIENIKNAFKNNGVFLEKTNITFKCSNSKSSVENK